MRAQLPPRHPPLPPIRISLNLDEIPFDETPTFPSEPKEQVYISRIDTAMMMVFMKNQIKPKNIAESNFASAFVSQSELMDEDASINVPKIPTHKNSVEAFSRKAVVERPRRKEPRHTLRRNK